MSIINQFYSTKLISFFKKKKPQQLPISCLCAPSKPSQQEVSTFQKSPEFYYATITGLGWPYWFSMPEVSDPGVNFSLVPFFQVPPSYWCFQPLPLSLFLSLSSPLPDLSQIKLVTIRKGVILFWNIVVPAKAMTHLASFPDLSACTDVEVGCLKAVVNVRRGCNIYFPPWEVSGPTC